MKKNLWIAIAAGAAAFVAGAVAIAAYLRKKSKALSEHLDYDPDEYFEDDCSCDEEEEPAAEEDAADQTAEEETIPLHPEEEKTAE